jgi:hypothetical protein
MAALNDQFPILESHLLENALVLMGDGTPEYFERVVAGGLRQIEKGHARNCFKYAAR